MTLVADTRTAPQLPVPFSRRWKADNTTKGVHVEKCSVDNASFYMLNLYRANLQVRLSAIDPASLQTRAQHDLYAAVSDMLAAPADCDIDARNLAWDELFKAESLIALLCSGGALRQEIASRLQDLVRSNPADANTLRSEYDALLETSNGTRNGRSEDVVLRKFLLRVLETLHWNAKQASLARPIRVQATNRIAISMLVPLAMLVLPYIFINLDYTTATLSKWWSVFPLWAAISAGLLGAFFSRLISVQGQWTKMSLDEAFQNREWTNTWLRAGVGVCGALVVYFFLRSGIAEGSLFPTFSGVTIEFVDFKVHDVPRMSFVVPSKDLALLTFWCFIAGFSEKFVPTILSSTERKFAGLGAQPQAKAANN